MEQFYLSSTNDWTKEQKKERYLLWVTQFETTKEFATYFGISIEDATQFVASRRLGKTLETDIDDAYIRGYGDGQADAQEDARRRNW